MGYDDEDSDDENTGSKINPGMQAWRGLANYRTQMKRQALKRDRDQRTTSDVYLLEDIVSDVRFLCDLPIALRLDICKVLGYELHQPGYRVAKQGGKAFYFFIIFTGSVKCTYHQLGVIRLGSFLLVNGSAMEYSKTGIIHGNTALTQMKRQSCSHSLEETTKESLTSKRLQSFGNGSAFSRESNDSKVCPNRAFCGWQMCSLIASTAKTEEDDSVEMYFIVSGECRVVLEVPNKKLHTPLPRASSFLKQYWPTQYHPCQMGDKDKQKDWWHPSLEQPRASTMAKATKAGTTPRKASRCRSVYSGRLPTGLGAAILRNPDTVFGLVHRRKSPKRKSVPAAVRRRQSEVTPIALVDSPPTRKRTGSLLRRRRSSRSTPKR